MGWKKEQVIELLARYKQRATYGALAEVVGGNPRNVMQGMPKNATNAWIVAVKNNKPTGYPAHLIPHSDARRPVIKTGHRLRQWLQNLS